ncbi:hypothetical protein WI23_18470 [Burkholderia oklahomensis C6786]|nr:hypothetical protein WI23_18470 [Burkholderia oklahomensis C6786]KUY50219.1 hypothetical protein WI23_03495 [Burkholderia oklahomensis C6786]
MSQAAAVGAPHANVEISRSSISAAFAAESNIRRVDAADARPQARNDRNRAKPLAACRSCT